MLNVGKIENGIVIDHIPAGKSMDIYRYLGLGELDSCVAIIKDIIKVDGGEDLIDINLLGFIDTNITVNIIRNGEIAEKKQLTLPEKVTNIISCKNPRCITQIEQELDQIFYLTDKEKHIYRCKYCEEKY